MNQGYTQSKKKADMAAKMVTKYKMNGPDKTQDGSGMKFKGNGKQGIADRMKPKMNGSGKGSMSQKPKQSNGKAHFSNTYSQNGNKN